MNLTLRELSTVLAALRYWQRERLASNDYEHDIATNYDATKPLTDAEIDELCIRLNVET